jgi:putative transposase
LARFARVVIPDLPHHVTQRGNRRERIFFEPGDEQVYLDLLTAQLRRRQVACWSYCLMPNHVHLVLTPSDETGLALAVGEAHRRYTVFVSARAGWTGHLFQGRFASVAMDEDHLLAAFRYIALNPVKARLTKRPQDWPWSSAPALLAGRSTPHVDVAPALARIEDPAAFLSGEDDAEGLWRSLLAAETVGRPLGAADWVKALEAKLGVRLTPKKRGPPPRDAGDGPLQEDLPL